MAGKVIAVFIHEVIPISSEIFSHFNNYFLDIILCEISETQVHALSEMSKYID
jgi:hypothetical protein